MRPSGKSVKSAIGSAGRGAVGAVMHLDQIVSFLKNTAVLFFFAMMAPFVYNLLSKSTIVVQEVSVPQDLEARGLTGRVFSQRVIDKILEIANYTELLKEREDVYGLAKKNQRPDIDLPITVFGINFETLLSFLKTAAGGQDIRVVGEVVTELPADEEKKTPAKYGVRFRVAKVGTVYRSAAPTATLDELADKAAFGVMEEYEPITMAYYYRGKRDFENAFRMTEKALLKRRPGDEVWAHFLRGLIESDQGRWKSAEEEFRFVLERNPDFPRARSNLSRVLRRGGDLPAALEEAERALVSESTLFQSYHNKALALVGLNRHDEALVWLKKAEEVDSTSELVQLELADFYRSRAGAQELALKHYRLAADLKPDNSRIYANWAGMLGDLGRWDEAEKVTLKALSFNARNGIALGYLGYIALERRDIVKAQRFYTEAYAADPTYFRAHIGLGRVAMAERDFGKAEELFARALAESPRWWDIFKFQGDLMLLRGRHDEAEAKWKRALEINPRAADVEARFAHLALHRGDEAKAQRHAARAAQMSPGLFKDAEYVLKTWEIH